MPPLSPVVPTGLGLGLPSTGITAAVILAVAVCAPWTPPVASAEDGRVTVTVDVGTTGGLGGFGFEYGVDHGPLCAAPCLHWSAAGVCLNHSAAVSVAGQLRAMGATYIRTHDSGVLDWPIVFPHSLSLATGAATPDTTDPANYRWEAADAYFAQIVGAGLLPYFRLGTSWGQPGGGLPAAGVPYNRTALVDVLLHTVMHYNDGWGGTVSGEGNSLYNRHPADRPQPSRGAAPAAPDAAAAADARRGKLKPKPLRYLEVWNEPDSAAEPGNGRFWNRTAAEFHVLVGDVILALKAYDPSLQVGSDGCALVEWPGSGPAPPTVQNRSEYSWGLMAALATRKVPLDFFSWHAYTDNVGLFGKFATDVRRNLDAVGYTGVKQHVTEWAPSILTPEQDTALGAATVGATLTTLIEHNVSLATFYPACSMDEGNRTGGKGWGIWDSQSEPGAVLKRRMTSAFELFGELIQRTPERMRASIGGGNPDVADPDPDITVTALAGKNASAVNVLLSAQRGSFSSVELVFANLPGGSGGWEFTVRVINAGNGIAPKVVAGGALPPTHGLTIDLAPPAVALISLVQLKNTNSTTRA